MKRWLTKKITRTHLDKFLAERKNDKYTLDIGCANSPYRDLFPNRVGFDVAEGPGVDVVGDAHMLPFDDSLFDQILCTEVLEHLHTPDRAITEMHRVLKPDGTLVLTTRFCFPIHDAPHDYFRYTKYGLRHLFNVWDIEFLGEEVKTGSTISVLLQRIGYQTRLRMNLVSKIVIFLIAKLVRVLDWLIQEEFGNLKNTTRERTILTSGYHLIARKK